MPTGGHGIWPGVYGNPGLYEWMFSVACTRAGRGDDGEGPPAAVAIRRHRGRRRANGTSLVDVGQPGPGATILSDADCTSAVARIVFSFMRAIATSRRISHVERDDCEAKFWLDPVWLQWSDGF